MKSKRFPFFTASRPAALYGFAALITPASAVTGSWIPDAAGNWATAANWSDGIPNGEGNVANLTNNITASRAISLGGTKTVGALNIGDSGSGFFSFSVNSGTPASSLLIFDQIGETNATLTVPVTSGVAANSIGVSTLVLNDDLTITSAFPNSTTVQLAISGAIKDSGGGHGIIKEGQGIIQLSGANSYRGGTTLNGGRININHLTALGTGPVTVASGAQAFVNSASSYADFNLSGTGYVNSADVAAQAGALRLANNRVVIGNVTVQATGARLGVDAAAVGFISGNLVGAGNLEINGPTTTTGSVTLLGSAAGYTGVLNVARGSFNFTGDFGGSISVEPAAAATTNLGTGTSLAGSLSLDSTHAPATLRNTKGTLAISGNLSLTGSTPVVPVAFPAPGTDTLTLLTYAAVTGSGSLTFDSTSFRGSPLLSVGSTSAVVSGLNGQTRTWANTAADNIWNVGTTANWTGGDGKFFNADAVVFGDSTFGSVTLEGTLTPHSVTFNSTGTNDFLIDGTGTIEGAVGGIIKNGDAWLTLGGSNTFTGPVAVNAGRLILGNPLALGFTSGVTVAAGASLDVNGKATLAVSRSFDVVLAGPGDGNDPSLTNTGASIPFAGTPSSGIRNVTLTADATVGGGIGKTFDIGGNGIIDGRGFTLTKQGANQVVLVGVTKNLRTVVEGGTLTGFGPDPFGSLLTIKSGGTAEAASLGTYTSEIVIESGGILQHSVGVESLWTGKVTAAGNVTLSNGNVFTTSLTLGQGFTVPGDLLKSGIGTVTLLGSVAVAGNVTVTGGPLALGNGGTGGDLGTTAPILLSGSGSSLSINRSTVYSLANTIWGDGGVIHSGTGTTTLTADNPYTGLTTISNGTLLVNGNQSGGGNVTVASGATLGGTGILPGAVTIAVGANLAPGGSALGTFRLGSDAKAVTLNGTLRINHGGSATTLPLAVADGLTLGAASTLAFTDSGSALTAPAYILATYGSLTGTFATVTNLPAGYSLVYNHDDGTSANHIALVKTGSPFTAWISGFYPGVTDPAIVGPQADPDADGQANALEFALGGTPNSSVSRAKTHSFTADGSDEDTVAELLLTIAVRSGTPAFTGSPSPSAILDGFVTTVTGSTDLVNFTAPVSVTTPATSLLPDAPAGYEYRTFSLGGSNGLPGKGFLRVSVTP